MFAALMLATLHAANATEVLLVSDPGGTLDPLQAALTATGLFTQVDTWNAGASEPTLQDLQAYAAVVLHAGNEVSATLGADLFTFMDQGGNLVTDATLGWWISRGYVYPGLDTALAIDASGARFGGPAAITWQLPASPLLSGVGAVTIPYYLDNAGVTAPGATLIGTFGAAAAVATWHPTSTGTVTTLGFNLTPAVPATPQGIDFSASDVTVLVANALLAPPGPGRFAASTAGVCPGSVTFGATLGTPSGPLALVSGTGPGALVIPSGPCAGATLPLAGARLRAQARFDAAGTWSLTRSVLTPAACGAPVAVVDLTTCEIAMTGIP